MLYSGLVCNQVRLPHLSILALMSNYGPEDFGGSDEESHYMNSKQGHEDPPVEGGYTGFSSERRVPRFPPELSGSITQSFPDAAIDRSKIGGLGHVCGLYCDGQDRGGGCDVQDRYYADQQRLANMAANEPPDYRRRIVSKSDGITITAVMVDEATKKGLSTGGARLPNVHEQLKSLNSYGRLLTMDDMERVIEENNAYRHRIYQLEDQLREIHERSKPR
jgi:hypothetical protein